MLTKPYDMLCLSSCPSGESVGVDMTSPPSKMTMMSLAFDSEFRGAIEKVRHHVLLSFSFFFTMLDVYSSSCLSSYCFRIAHVMLCWDGWDELVVDDRTEERRGGRHTRSKSLCLYPTLHSLQASDPLPSHPGWSEFAHLVTLTSKIQNLQNMMGSIGEPGQAGDDVGGRKK